MDTYDQPELANTLREALKDYGGVRLAILFGSRATGRATAHSDLDLAVQTSACLLNQRPLDRRVASLLAMTELFSLSLNI